MKSDKKNALNLESELGGDDGEEGHKKKLKKYSKAKNHQVTVWTYLKDNVPTLSREAELLDGCSRSLIFRHWHTVSKYRLIGGCTCKKHLLCAMCALRRSAKTVREVKRKVNAVLQENPSLVPVLITFTVVNGFDLSERYEFVTSNKKKLLQRRRSSISNKRLKNKSITRFINGSFGSYEFKKGSGSGEWHPHSHEIALLDPVFDFTEIHEKGKDYLIPLKFREELRQEWINLCSDGSWSVDVKRLKPEGDINDHDSLMKTICEASKYALKLNEIEVEDQIEAYKVLSGRRLTFSYGSLWGIKIPEDLHDDIEAELELLPYVDLVYSFYSGKYNLTDKTDTKDLLVSPRPLKEVVEDETRKKKFKKIQSKTSVRFSDKVKDYAQKVKKEEQEAFTCFSLGPQSLESKALYFAHLESLKGDPKI